MKALLAIGLVLASIEAGADDELAEEPPLALQVVHGRLMTAEHGFIDVGPGVFLNPAAALLIAKRLKSGEVEVAALEKAPPVPPTTTLVLVLGALALGLAGGVAMTRAR